MHFQFTSHRRPGLRANPSSMSGPIRCAAACIFLCAGLASAQTPRPTLKVGVIDQQGNRTSWYLVRGDAKKLYLSRYENGTAPQLVPVGKIASMVYEDLPKVWTDATAAEGKGAR